MPIGVEPIVRTPEEFGLQIAEEIRINATLAKMLALKGT